MGATETEMARTSLLLRYAGKKGPLIHIPPYCPHTIYAADRLRAFSMRTARRPPETGLRHSFGHTTAWFQALRRLTGLDMMSIMSLLWKTSRNTTGLPVSLQQADTDHQQTASTEAGTDSTMTIPLSALNLSRRSDRPRMQSIWTAAPR